MARKKKEEEVPEAQGSLMVTEEAAAAPAPPRKPRSLPAPAKPEAPAIIPGSPENMLLEAIQHGLPVETMERLMSMRRELRDERAKSEYFAAMAGFQGDCPVIIKNKMVHEKDAPTVVRYRYATIDMIVEQTKEIRSRWGLSHTLKTKQTATEVTAICTVYHTSGWSESTEFTVPIDPKAYMSAPQKVASALTFAKRYALCNAYGIVTGDEDDDGQEVGYEVLGDESRDPVEAGRPVDVSARPSDKMSEKDLYEGIERELQKLPNQKASPLLATALRLRDQGNSSGALKALYESVLRIVANAAKEGQA